MELQLRKQMEDYFDIDGYSLFYEAVQKMIEEGLISPILNKHHNGRTPSLPLTFWVNTKRPESKFDRLEMLKKSDLLDFSYYERHPEWQTADEWERILKVYDFLCTESEREVVSLEERSLELFGHEKFLIDSDAFPQGKDFLRRIGLSAERLKAAKYGEPFVFWLKRGCDVKDMKRILIVENLSFFHTCISLLESEQLDYEPELVIYGEGKKIEKSFPFFFRLFEEKPYLFYYAGDMDAEGYSILVRLMNKYPDCSIQPALKIYRRMLAFQNRTNTMGDQVKNEEHRESFFSWFTEEEQTAMMQLWQDGLRIPQEVLTIETWRC